MNIFRSLIGKVWQDPNAAEVVKISSGQLFLTRAGILRSNRECIFNDAMITIRRIPNIEHNFQLVITKVYEEEDQELLEDEDETDDERVFLISEELEFRTGNTDGEPTFIWRDLQGDVDELFEFVAQGINGPTSTFFESCMYRAMYERKYKQNADNVSDEVLKQFAYHPTAKTNPKPRRTVSRQVTDGPKTPTKAPPVVEAREPTPPPQKQQQDFIPKEDLPNTEPVISVEARLHKYNPERGEFDNEGIVTAQVLRRKDQDFVYYFAAGTADSHILLHEISSEMNARWSLKYLSVTWNYAGDRGPTGWLFQFADEDDYSQFMPAFTRALWETNHSMHWDKIKTDEQSYVLSSTTDEDVEMKDIADEEDDEDEVISALDPDEEPSDEEEEEYDEEDEDQPKPLKGERNSQLTVGYRGDRSYVVRGNNIGVFSQKERGNLKYYATISNIATPKGKEFKPDYVMLHDQDSKMILMNSATPHSVYNLDVERGKVVEEWKVHDDISINNIAPENKFAPTTREQTFVGTSHNALFRVDPRVSGSKLVDSQYKQYASKNKFSGVATTASGKLAVASEKGDIRLFDSIGKNAKTALPPLGDPILGIDVTADGRYIVATTKTYLLFIDTLIGDGKYSGQLGFDRSFPANAKPVPKRLQLRSEHVAYMGHNVSFTPAKFNQGEGQVENAIVTSTGPFVVAWDFAKVKRGVYDRYEIKKYEDHVVQDSFKFGDDKEIIVALDNNVLAINKKNLKKPTRQSLSAPLAYSTSGIVNAPY